MNLHRLFHLIACLVIFSATAVFATSFDEDFEDATLRVDFFQYGNADSEHIAIDRLIRQGRWAGPVDKIIAPHPYGRYLARVYDLESGETLFDFRFNSLFGEYRTTDSAVQGVVRVYHETILVPYPKAPIRLSVSFRSSTGEGTTLHEVEIDPSSVAIAVESPRAGATVVDAHIAGEPHTSLDIAIIGEGYTTNQIELFRTDVARFSQLLLSQEPYASRSAEINI